MKEGAAGMIYACNAVWGMLKCELRNSRTDKVYHPGERQLSGARDGNRTTTRYRTSLRYTQEYYKVIGHKKQCLLRAVRLCLCLMI